MQLPKSCVHSSPTDEPREKCKREASCAGKGNVFHAHSVLLHFYFSFILVPSLFPPLLCPLSLLPSFSRSLGILAQPAYLNWAGLEALTAQGGGTCLLSINNFRNSEIQVVPVLGRQYHTPEGGLLHTIQRILCLRLFFCFCFHRSDWAGSPSQWQIRHLQTTSAVRCA